MIARSHVKVVHAISGGAAASAAITTAALAALNASSGSARFAEFVAAHAAWFALAFVVTALFASTLGLAWHAICQRRGWTSVHAYWAAGAIAGAAPGSLWLIPSGAMAIAAFVVSYGAALGGLTGLVAWLIRRPDRDQISAGAPKSTSA